MMRMIMRKPLIDDPITNVERVAVELRTLRRARNITQQTLADRAQVARRTLTHAESAQNVGIQEWCRIANALGYELTLRPQNTSCSKNSRMCSRKRNEYIAVFRYCTILQSNPST